MSLSGIRFTDDPQIAAKLQQLAREEMKEKLLRDIRIDIEVCRLEGMEYKEYLQELKELIDDFLRPQ